LYILAKHPASQAAQVQILHVDRVEAYAGWAASALQLEFGDHVYCMTLPQATRKIQMARALADADR
jgi:hypothetical protein